MNKHINFLLTAFALCLALSTSQAHAKPKGSYFALKKIALHFDNAKKSHPSVRGLGWEHASSTKGLGWHTGAFSDRFGTRAAYIGVNYATPKHNIFNRKVRLLFGATMLRKKYHEDAGIQTKIVPLPVVELTLADNTILNVSGSPVIDSKGQYSNATMFIQLKMKI